MKDLLEQINDNIKRIADALESQTDIKPPASMSESYQYNPGTTKNQTDSIAAFRSFLDNLK